MNIIKRVVGLFSVMEEEVRSFRLLFLQSLFIGFANSYYYIASSTFLLKKVDVKLLPQSYIFTGLAGFLFIQVYKNSQRKGGIIGSFRMSLLTFSFVCFLNFFAMMKFGSNEEFSRFLAYFMVVFAAPFTAIFSLGLYAQCSRMYNMAQNKRLLALVVSGEILSSVIAFMSIPMMRGLIKGQEYVLLPVAAVFTLLVFIPFNKLIRLSGEKFSAVAAVVGARKINFSFLRKDKFFLLIAVVSLFSVFAIYVIDYAYLVSVRSMSERTGYEIAQIASVFLFVVKLGELSFSFLSGKILSSKGVKFSLMLLPVILLLFSALAYLSGFLSVISLLAFIFIGKLADRAIRKSITTPSIKVMYQVAEPHQRLDIEATIDGLLSQVTIVISGALLLVISLIFYKDIESLLKVFSLVSVLAFGLWCFFSLKMYDSYRVKIHDFLSRLKRHGVAKDSDNQVEGTDNLVQRNDELHLTEKIKITQNKISDATKEDLIKLLKIYNSKQFLDFVSEAPDKIARKLVQIYYSNNFYFSRLLIIKYLPYFHGQTAFTFLTELWEVSDLTGRLELIVSFNELKNKHVDAAFFERQCENCVNEIIWADATINDLAALKDESLEHELTYHRRLLVYLLFELLKPIYDPSVIQVIFDIITNDDEDIESQLFALELLDITLRPGLKEIIKPVIEPLSFEDKKQKLDKIFHIYHLSPKDRIIDILMKDYNMVNLKLRETALIAYNKISEEKNVLSAFRTHSIDNLKFKADEFFNGFATPVYHAKKELLVHIEVNYDFIRPYAPYIFNYAIFAPKYMRSKPGGHVNKLSNNSFFIDAETSSNVALKLDTLAIALLVTLKQRPLSTVPM